jgi:hypothetical protein
MILSGSEEILKTKPRILDVKKEEEWFAFLGQK